VTVAWHVMFWLMLPAALYGCVWAYNDGRNR
jgi:hypothetical protein